MDRNDGVCGPLCRGQEGNLLSTVGFECDCPKGPASHYRRAAACTRLSIVELERKANRELYMKFLHWDLGYKQRGEIVEVTLTRAANVRLMDSSDYSSYKSGRSHHYHGGLIKQSPFRMAIPSSGTWYFTVDRQGLQGATNASVRMLPGPLPEIREASLSSLPSLVRNPPPATASG